MQGVAGASKNIFSRHLDMKFDLPDNAYKTIANIGTGAYGVVSSAVHKKSGDKVAIKKIPNAFQELTTAKRTYRELKILRHFDHDNIIGIREILNPRGGVSELKDVYVVMDLMESDLHQIIHSTQPFSLEHTRYFLYQILKGLKYMHSANVVHRDLKPSNLLVNENCELKIGDFGMARGISMNTDSSIRKVFMTAYVATRWYRAPELLFSNDDYSFAVDMWSVGCIFAEMIGRKQIFPGKNPMHQLTLIVEALGMPPDKMLKSTNSDQIYNFFHKNFGSHKPVNFHAKYPGSNKKAIDLLTKMLVFNPAERISVKDALKHPFLSKYHDPDDEPDCLPAFDFSFEQEDLKKEQIRQRVGKMILKYQKNVFGPAKYSVPVKSDTNIGALQTTKVNQVTSSKPTSQAQGLGQMVAKGHYSGTLFKVPVAPVLQNTTTMGSFKPLLPKEADNSLTKSLCVTTEQGASSNINDVDMKSASSEGHSGLASNQNFLGASLRPAATGLTPESSDIAMRSAKSPAQLKQVTCVGKDVGEKNTLTVSPSSQSAHSGNDIEMKSAKGTPPVSSTLTGSNHLYADINVRLKPSASEDVTMQSARSPLVPKQATKVEDNSKKVENNQAATLLAGLQGTVTTETLDNQGSKTISDDTKALIKAALMNSVKNKLRKDSTSGACNKGGGKVTVTAQSRQREREEKRRQKLKRSQERQKKIKSKSQNQENTALLTDEDKSLLERWSKMQSGSGQSSQPKQRLKSDSSIAGNAAEQSAPVMQITGQNDSGQNQNVSLVTENKSLNPGKSASVQMFSTPNKGQLPASQNLVGSVKNGAQINMTRTANVNRSNVPNQRRIMPKSTSTLPSTFTIMTQLPVGQNVVTNPANSQGTVLYAGNVANGGITLASTSTDKQTLVTNPVTSQGASVFAGNVASGGIALASTTSSNQPQSQYVIPEHSVSSVVPQPSVSMTTTQNSISGVNTLTTSSFGNQPPTQYVIPSQSVSSVVPQHSVSMTTTQNSISGVNTLTTSSFGNQPSTQYVMPSHSVSSVIPQHSVSMTTTQNPTSSVSLPAHLQPKSVTKNSNFQPNISTKQEPASISDQSSYRTRIYSDRETPSPPQPLSPPTYEQALKSIQSSQSSEPTDLASVIQQFSKHAVEDIYPPVLVLTPRGDGAGYGLSLDLEDLLGGALDLPSVGQHPQPETFNNKPLDSAPLSPTLLSDWFELRNLNVADMQAVQQDVGMTSPFNMADLASLGNISPPTKS